MLEKRHKEFLEHKPVDWSFAEALSFALRYQGRKRVNHADDAMARITAERLVQHLEASGFVLMKGPPRGAPTTAHMPPGPGSAV